jgi:hypothetical protein
MDEQDWQTCGSWIHKARRLQIHGESFSVIGEFLLFSKNYGGQTILIERLRPTPNERAYPNV